MKKQLFIKRTIFFAAIVLQLLLFAGCNHST